MTGELEQLCIKASEIIQSFGVSLVSNDNFGEKAEEILESKELLA